MNGRGHAQGFLAPDCPGERLFMSSGFGLTPLPPLSALALRMSTHLERRGGCGVQGGRGAARRPPSSLINLPFPGDAFSGFSVASPPGEGPGVGLVGHVSSGEGSWPLEPGFVDGLREGAR